MKTLTVSLIAASALLVGCVSYPDQYGAPNYGGDSTYSNRPVVDHGRYDSSGRYDSTGRYDSSGYYDASGRYFPNRHNEVIQHRGRY